MHPFILQQTAAEHVKDQLAAADDTRRARQARRARSRASRQRTPLSLPGTQAVLAKVADWVTRHNRMVEVSYGGDTLKLGRATTREQQEKITEGWLARHPADS